MYTDTEQHHESFLDTYARSISPRLKDIDLFMKTSGRELDIGQVSRLLSLSTEEIRSIMERNNLSRLNKQSFFTVMAQGSSSICRLFKREVDCGSPYIYTREHVSYIYDLDIETVNKTCDKLHIKELTAFTLPELFSNIPV